jgi:hypothetical protein
MFRGRDYLADTSGSTAVTSRGNSFLPTLFLGEVEGLLMNVLVIVDVVWNEEIQGWI